MKWTQFFFAGLLCSQLVACGEEKVVQGKDVPRQAESDEQDAGADEQSTPVMQFSESDFVESESMRDPFRSYAKVFVDEARGEVRSQHEVVLEQYSIDELKLVAIIGGISPARAMVIDPTGLGHVVQRGQYLGRANVVQPTGGVGAAYEVNWRIDRIRGEDLVLVRDDPSNPDMPSSTRVMALRADEQEEAEVEGENIKNELEEIRRRLAQMAEASSGSDVASSPDASSGPARVTPSEEAQ